ncbi:hypothetical protein SDC9_40197 [bioreactor metagenome]|uniref:NusG-like N-terminal domain-containing protein n=1 Tax=bioreactor metagenome TaxID=1076179 RepID=A0A644VRM5_9ZZZZ
MKMKSEAWYALHVVTGQEMEIAGVVGMLPGCTASAPLDEMVVYDSAKRTHSMQYATLFPGYVFIRCPLTPETYYQLIAIPGVLRLLGVTAAGDLPEPIPDEDIWWIGYERDYKGCIGLSEAVRNAEGHIEIVGGALKTLQPYITKIVARQHYAIVELPIGGTVHRLRLGVVVR